MDTTHFSFADAVEARTWEALYATAAWFLPCTLRLLGVADQDLPDVSQEVLFATYRSLGRFDPTRFQGVRIRVPGAPGHTFDAYSAWLYGIAWRQVSRYLKRAYHRRERPAGLLDTVCSHDFAVVSGPDEGIVARERLELTSRLLGSVAPERRAILILSDAYDVPVVEIAAVLEIKLATAVNRLRLARRDYRAAVKRLRPEDRRAVRSGLLLVPLLPEVLVQAGEGGSDVPEAPRSAPDAGPRAEAATGGAWRSRRGLAAPGRGLLPYVAGFAGAVALVLVLEPTPMPWARHFGAPALHLAMTRVGLPAGAGAAAGAGAGAAADAGAAAGADAAAGAGAGAAAGAGAGAAAGAGAGAAAGAGAGAGAAAGAGAGAGGRSEPTLSGRAGSANRRDTLDDEQRQLAAAQEAVVRGDFPAALAQLAAHERRFPQGRLRLTRERMRAGVIAAQSGPTDTSPPQAAR